MSRYRFIQQIQSASAGSQIVRSRLDGITRVYGYSSVPDYRSWWWSGSRWTTCSRPAHRQRTSMPRSGFCPPIRKRMDIRVRGGSGFMTFFAINDLLWSFTRTAKGHPQGGHFRLAGNSAFPSWTSKKNSKNCKNTGSAQPGTFWPGSVRDWFERPKTKGPDPPPCSR